MDRPTWTDERLDDLSLAMREGFSRVDRELAEVKTEIRKMRSQMFQLWGADMLAIIVAIATVIITNS
jgi:hypothetical protein